MGHILPAIPPHVIGVGVGLTDGRGVGVAGLGVEVAVVETTVI